MSQGRATKPKGPVLFSARPRGWACPLGRGGAQVALVVRELQVGPGPGDGRPGLQKPRPEVEPKGEATVSQGRWWLSVSADSVSLWTAWAPVGRFQEEEGVARGDEGGLLGITTVRGRAGPRGSGLLPCELAEGFPGNTPSCVAQGAGSLVPGPPGVRGPHPLPARLPPDPSYLEKSDLKRPLPPTPTPTYLS